MQQLVHDDVDLPPRRHRVKRPRAKVDRPQHRPPVRAPDAAHARERDDPRPAGLARDCQDVVDRPPRAAAEHKRRVDGRVDALPRLPACGQDQVASGRLADFEQLLQHLDGGRHRVAGYLRLRRRRREAAQLVVEPYARRGGDGLRSGDLMQASRRGRGRALGPRLRGSRRCSVHVERRGDGLALEGRGVRAAAARVRARGGRGGREEESDGDGGDERDDEGPAVMQPAAMMAMLPRAQQRSIDRSCCRRRRVVCGALPPPTPLARLPHLPSLSLSLDLSDCLSALLRSHAPSRTRKITGGRWGGDRWREYRYAERERIV